MISNRILYLLCLPLIVLLIPANKASAQAQKGGLMSIKITSSAFTQNGNIPKKYSCDGVNVSLPLSWTDAPSDTKSFAIIVEDPDAPSKTWIHWVIFNIPPADTSLSEHFPTLKEMSNGIRQGTNDFRNIGYGGPCPPSGTHRYFIKIYALNMMLKIPAGSTKQQLELAMKGHILAEGELLGKYSRQ